MSVDFAHAQALISEHHGTIRQTVLSRKRKLSELFRVTKSSDNLWTPSTASPDAAIHDPSLASFLDHNDIEKGRYFSETSLPPRPVFQLYSSSTPDSLLDVKASSPSSANPSQPSPTHVPTTEAPTEDPLDRATGRCATTSPDLPPVEDAPQVSSADGRDSPQPAGLPPEAEAPTKTTLSDASEGPHSNARSKTSPSPARNLKPSRPESPPYSPASKALGDNVHSLTASAGPHEYATNNVLTPQKDDHDSDPAIEGPDRQDDRPRTLENVSDLVDGTRLVDGVSAVHGSASSNSSTAGHPSLNTAKTAPQSPATSHYDDISVSQQAQVMLSGQDGAEGISKNDVSAHVDASHLNELDPNEGTSARKSSSGHPIVEKVHEDLSRAPSAIPAVVPPIDRDRSWNGAGIQKRSKARTRKGFVLSMTRKSARWRKRQEQLFATAYHRRHSFDYYQPLILSQALNSHHSKDLKSLIENRPKVLSTSEREIVQREDAARLVLLRIQHLQGSNRWSLRQMKPAVEPPSQQSPWDAMVKEARWLRMDFKEERKLKLAVAKSLADSCAEFVASTEEERKKLTSRSMEPLSACRSPGLDRDSINAAGQRVLVASEVTNQIPLFDNDALLHRDADGTWQGQPDIGRMDTRLSQDTAEVRLESLAPEEGSCALFGDDGRHPLRQKMNATMLVKPPNRTVSPMPPQPFYESRSASHWTAEDDMNLRQKARQIPANWFLISQELSSKSEFSPSSERRTPWECFERFVMLEANVREDMQQRALLKPFIARTTQARHHFDENQRNVQNQLQQARENGQTPPNIPVKAYPEPRNVDRKSSRRFMALLDMARKLKKRRESSISKQERSQQAEARPQQNATGPSRISHDPLVFSNKKYELEQKEKAEFNKFQEHRKALIEAQRKQHAGYPAALSHGIGQQMQSGMASNGVSANNHLAVPGMQRYGRPDQHPPSLPNGMPGRGQVPMQGRPQTGNQGQRPVSQVNQEGVSNMMQHQQPMHQRYQNSQHQLQSQPVHQQSQNGVHTSPTAAQALPQGGMQSSNDNHLSGAVDNASSPHVQHGSLHHHSGSQSSPHTQQALAAAAGHNTYHGMNGNRPQALSSGQVPQMVAIEHEIKRMNPGLGSREVSQQATERLKVILARQSAITAASGARSPGPSLPQQQQQIGSHAMPSVGSQSPYQQHSVPTPQMQSPYQQNGILASNHMPQHNGHHGHSGGMTPQQQAYNTAMRKQMYDQQFNPMQGGSNGSGVSPHMGHPSAGFAGSNRTGRVMRPPSRSASGFDVGQYPQHNMQRPGSVVNAVQSPRPISAQGYGPQS